MRTRLIWNRWMAAALAGLLAVGAMTGCGAGAGRESGRETDISREATAEEAGESMEKTETEEGAAGTEAGKPGEYERIGRLGLGLLEKCAETSNPLVSPLSAYLALAMAGEGARGETRAEFEDVLGKNMDITSATILAEWPVKEKEATLQIADSLWLRTGFEANREWTDRIEKEYQARVEGLELSSEDAKSRINQWVSENTEGLIPEMLSQPLGEEVILALINTVYFKGDWKIPFDAEATKKADFRTADGNRIKTDMMALYRENLEYVKGENAEGVLLPYVKGAQGRELAFMALKPLGGMKVRDMVSELDPGTVSDMLKGREARYISLELPKLEIESDLDLKESMKALGLKRVFDEREADLTGMGTAPDGNLYISLLKQKAVLRVDEKGTEAAAATMAGVECSSAMEEPYLISFDEPFLYMILDVESGVPLFMGIVDQP